MIRSSTTSCAHLSAFCGADLSKAITFGAMVTLGIVGRIHSCADAEAGPEFGGGGRAVPAAVDTQPATSGPAPTVSFSVGVVPSASPAAGSGLWGDRSAGAGRGA